MNRSHTEKDAQLQDELDEVFLRHTMHEYMERCGEQLLEEEAALPDTEDSRPTAKQVRQLTRRLRKSAKQSGYKLRRIPRKALPLVAALIALLVITLITAGAFRFKLFNFLNVPGAVATEYGAQNVDDREYEFEYMPEGFSERFYTVEDDSIRTCWMNLNDKNQYVLIYITENTRRISPDTEDAQILGEVQINDLTGELSQKGNLLNIAWTDPATGTTYLVQSTIEQTETINIAEGITKK